MTSKRAPISLVEINASLADMTFTFDLENACSFSIESWHK
jgi:hypothetical protein